MGNCQAAEEATVVILHPGGANKIERIYWSVSASQVMTSNPGHYVAQVVTSPTLKSDNGLPLKQLKLLRPDDTLLIGQVYRLICFEDVLKEFATKKCVKLGKLLRGRERFEVEIRMKDLASKSDPTSKSKSGNSIEKTEQDDHDHVHRVEIGSGGGSSSSSSLSQQRVTMGRQWRPALQSIEEFGI